MRRVVPGRMRRSVAWVGCVLCCAALPVHAGPDPAPEAAAARARKSLARVSWFDRRRPQDAFVRTGVAVRADGLLLVAGPVVTGSDRFSVRLPDGAVVPGQLVGADPETALSLLRVQGHTLQPLAGLDPKAKATKAAPPAPVMLVTSDGALARGALRATGRHDRLRLQGRTKYTTALLEAALVSLAQDRGAPWLAPSGDVVALHYGRALGNDEAARARARAEGLRLRREVVASYGVPAAVARIVWPLLADGGRVPRGALNASVTAIDEATRAQLCPGCGGLLVVDVHPDGAGARAGLRKHDIVVAVAGVKIPIGGTLHDALLPHRPGASVQVTVLRAGASVTMPVVLGERTRRVGAVVRVDPK